jgi:hypothetical protein
MIRALLVSVLLMTAGCGLFTAPKPVFIRMHTDTLTAEHNPSARQGWDDGCESGYAVFGNHFYKAYYDYKRDPNKVGDRQYEMNWYEAYHFCRQHANTLMNEGVF